MNPHPSFCRVPSRAPARLSPGFLHVLPIIKFPFPRGSAKCTGTSSPAASPEPRAGLTGSTGEALGALRAPCKAAAFCCQATPGEAKA